jgi:sec-independent protein translocase protein TatB
VFDIGWSELLIIGVVALIVIGPRDLPDLFRTLGRFTAKLRRMAGDFQRAMEAAANESGAKDIAKDLKAVANPKAMGLDAVKEAAAKFEKWDPLKPMTAKPAAPSPAAAPAAAPVGDPVTAPGAAPVTAAGAATGAATGTPAAVAETAVPERAAAAPAAGPHTAALERATAERKAAAAEKAAALRAAREAQVAAPASAPAVTDPDGQAKA